MNFLLFVVLPALVIGAMTHYSAGVEAFLILCAVWLRDLARDNQQQAERKQQDNKLRDLQNELDILHQRINHLRQPENDLPADAAARESIQQPENRLSVSRETARQPETRVTPTSAHQTAHPTTPQPVHPSQSIGQPENHPNPYHGCVVGPTVNSLILVSAGCDSAKATTSAMRSAGIS